MRASGPTVCHHEPVQDLRPRHVPVRECTVRVGSRAGILPLARPASRHDVRVGNNNNSKGSICYRLSDHHVFSQRCLNSASCGYELLDDSVDWSVISHVGLLPGDWALLQSKATSFKILVTPPPSPPPPLALTAVTAAAAKLAISFYTATTQLPGRNPCLLLSLSDSHHVRQASHLRRKHFWPFARCRVKSHPGVAGAIVVS